MRLAILSSHPIQYNAPLFRAIARRSGVEFTALFCSDHGLRPSYDPGFKRMVQYDVPLLEGYEYRFLKNRALRPGPGSSRRVNPEIAEIVRSDRFDAVVLYGYSTPTSLLALLTPGRRVRLLMRGDSNVRRERPAVLGATKRLMLPMLLSRVDHFLVSGTLNAQYYASYGAKPERMTLAPFSVDNEYFAERAQSARASPHDARRKLNLPTEGPLFLVSGKLQKLKRPFDVLHAFARARLRAPCTLAFAGDGECREELRIAIDRLGLESSVRLLGFRNQSELPALYGAADALILASEHEAWGLVVNEAMACGAIPIVSDQVGAGPDLVPDPQYVFRTGDVAGLASILERFAVQQEQLGNLREAVRVRIARWGIEQTADGFLEGVAVALQRSRQ